MEIREGYKRTEVGVIPQEWECVELGELCKYINDGTHNTPIYFAMGIPFYSVENVVADNFKNVKYISKEEHNRLIKRCLPEKGDILLTRIGSVGKTKLIDWDVNASIYVSLALLKVNEVVNSSYLYAYTKSNIFVNEIEKKALMNAVPPKINMGNIKSVSIALPKDKFEQQAIATALSDVDGLINSLTKLIDKKKNIKQGAMQELLTGKKRLDGFSGDWVESELGQICDIIKGQQLNRSSLRDTGIYYALNGGITPSGYTDQWNRKENTISISEGGESCGFVNYNSEKFWCGGHCYTLENISENIDKTFLFQILKTNEIFIMALRIGSGLPNVQKKSLKEFKVTIPQTIEEQTAIAAVLSDMDNEIEELEKKLSKYKDIKQGMMQELLTGRIRLVEAAIEVKPIEKVTTFEKPKQGGHTKEFDEAVVVSAIVSRYASEQFPIGAFRRQKFAYLFHRHCEQKAEGYEKFAAGPYNYHTKYGGAEKIAQRNKYVKEHTRDKIKGFVVAEKCQQAIDYFYEWYGSEILEWLDQFKFVKKEELELLTTVDMAIVDLIQARKPISVQAVKLIIQNSKKWKEKLNRAIFSDDNIKRAIEWSNRLFEN